MRDPETAARVVERFLSASVTLPTSHSAPFSRGTRDRKRVENLFLAYVGPQTSAEITEATREFAKALQKALPGCACSVPNAGVNVLPSSFGIIEANVTCESPARSARILMLQLRSNVGVDPAERHFLSPNSVFMPPTLTLGLFDPASHVYPTIEKKFTKLPTAKDAVAMLKEFGVEKMIKQLGGPFKGKRSGKPTLKEVKNFITGLRTYMDLEEETPEGLFYSTRDNGDMSDDRPGGADIEEARRIIEALRHEFGSANIHATWEGVDEWTHLNVSLK
jgi:hypothetical protein